MKLKVEFKEENAIDVEFTESGNAFEVEFKGIQQVSVMKELYEGSYEVTPTSEQQVLHTADKVMTEDVVVHAIPKEYGLITYNQDKIIKIT